MWRSQAGHNVSVDADQDDDWETDPDFVNDVSEKDQRWGSKTIEGSGRMESINIQSLKKDVSHESANIVKKNYDESSKGSYGYGGKFGVQKDRMDKAIMHQYDVRERYKEYVISSECISFACTSGEYLRQHRQFCAATSVLKSAVGHDYVAQTEKHASQKDYSTGFGGKFGVQKERVDQSAVGYDYQANVEKHESQKDYSKGFGGRYGVQKDRQDKSAVGWEDHEKLSKHGSQKDYAQGFGGKFGVQKDRVDKSAVGWDHIEKTDKHASQKDYSQGFGGKFGVQNDRIDKSAVGWDHVEKSDKHASQKVSNEPPVSTNNEPYEGYEYLHDGDYAVGFGGKFGVQQDRQDQSAVGWEHVEKTEKHASQKDYAQGFGGKFGVQQDRQDKSAVGWEHVEKTEKHASQKDYSQGFGGKYGVQSDRQDSAAHGWEENDSKPAQQASKRPEGLSSGGARSLKARFEQMAVQESSKDAGVDRVTAAREARKKQEEEEKRREAELRAQQPQDEEEGDYEAAEPEHCDPSPTFESNKVEEEDHLTAEVESTRAPEPSYEPAEHQEEITSPTQEGWGSDDVTAVASFTYEADEEDELSFAIGDVITNIEKVDEGWWEGECHGKRGLFPQNYVQLNA